MLSSPARRKTSATCRTAAACWTAGIGCPAVTSARESATRPTGCTRTTSAASHVARLCVKTTSTAVANDVSKHAEDASTWSRKRYQVSACVLPFGLREIGSCCLSYCHCHCDSLLCFSDAFYTSYGNSTTIAGQATE